MSNTSPTQAEARPAAANSTMKASAATAGTSAALLFFAATINYIDRQVIGILKPTLQAEFGWTEIDYADIVFAFQLAYAIGFLFAGRMMDWLGTKTGYALALIVLEHRGDCPRGGAGVRPGSRRRSSASVGLAYSASVAGFMFARFALGFGEAGNFPAAIKVVAEWFPKTRARVCDRPLQLRHEHRRAGHARWSCRGSRSSGAGTGRS